MRYALVIALFLASCAQAQHIGSLYTRDSDGSMLFRCTVFPIAHDKHTYTVLTADHCIDSGSYFVSFEEDSPTFYAATVGKEDEDFAYLTFDSVRAYDLFALGDSDSLKVRDEVVVPANPLGVGESVYEGYVSMVKFTRPFHISGAPVDIVRYFSIQMPAYPGASGSPILHNGKVVGILVASSGGTTTIGLKINVVK